MSAAESARELERLTAEEHAARACTAKAIAETFQPHTQQHTSYQQTALWHATMALVKQGAGR